MMPKKRNWFVLELIATSALMIIAITVVVLLFPSLKSSDLAAMVQAVGSVAAIFTAIFVMWWQSERAADIVRREIARRLAVTEALVERGFQMSILVEKHTQPIDNYYDYCFSVIDPVNIESTLIALKSLPLHTLDSFDIVVGVQNMIVWLEKLEPLVAIHMSKNDVHYVFEGDALSSATYVCKNIKAARDLVRAAISELGYRHHKTYELTIL